MNQFYYLDQLNEQRVPVYAADLPSYGVTGSTLVWAYWMDDWTPANQVPELAPYFPQSSPAPDQTVVYAADPNAPITPNNPYPANNPYAPNNPYQTNNPNALYEKPSNYLVGAILSTIFCCPAFGIAGIVYGAKVNSLYAAGDIEGAKNASEKARTWTVAAIITGFVLSIIYGIILYNINKPTYYDTSDLPYPEVEVPEFSDSISSADSYYSDDSYSDDSYSDDSDDSETILRLALTYAKANLPEEVDEGIVITDVKLTDDCFLYIAECDEDIVDIDILNAVKGELQSEITKSLKEEMATDSDIQEFVRYCKKANKGIGYKYVGTKSGKSCTVKIPFSKL